MTKIFIQQFTLNSLQSHMAFSVTLVVQSLCFSITGIYAVYTTDKWLTSWHPIAGVIHHTINLLMVGILALSLRYQYLLIPYKRAYFLHKQMSFSCYVTISQVVWWTVSHWLMHTIHSGWNIHEQGAVRHTGHYLMGDKTDIGQNTIRCIKTH